MDVAINYFFEIDLIIKFATPSFILKTIKYD